MYVYVMDRTCMFATLSSIPERETISLCAMLRLDSAGMKARSVRKTSRFPERSKWRRRGRRDNSARSALANRLELLYVRMYIFIHTYINIYIHTLLRTS